jgi:hypothetical protein
MITERAKKLVSDIDDAVNGFLWRSSMAEYRDGIYEIAQAAIDEAIEEYKQTAPK